MRTIFGFALAGAAFVFAAHASAQAVDPGVTGPVRRAAAAVGDAAGVPGVQNRIEQREQARDLNRAANSPNPTVRANSAARAEARAADPNHWRYRYHNNRWWYYTPQNNWLYYHNNNWNAYNANTYVPRYQTGYRGNYGPAYRGGYGPATTPYSNGTPAGNTGSNLGANIGAAIGGAAGANTGAAIGGAIGNPIGAAENAVPVPAPAPAPVAAPVPANHQPAGALPN